MERNNIDEMLREATMETEEDKSLDKRRKEFIENAKKDNERSQKIKKIVVIASLVTIASLGTVSLIKECQFRNTPYYKLDKDLNVHNGTATVDGIKINPYYEHDCVIGGPEEGSISERFQKYCEENDITLAEQEKLKEKYPDLLEKLNEKDLDLSAKSK